MSGAAKRSHEETTHSSSKYSHDDSTAAYHPTPYDIPHKIRTEARDLERRSSPLYRYLSEAQAHVDNLSSNPNPNINPSPNPNPSLSPSPSPSPSPNPSPNPNPITIPSLNPTPTPTPIPIPNPYLPEDRDRDRDRDRERDKLDSKDPRHDNKEMKHDREDVKSEAKTDKDAYAVSTTHLNWKDSKEYQRGKRFSDAHPLAATDPWISRATSQGHAELGKEVSTTEERDHVEPHEAVGENKFDDKSKERDRKRKDMNVKYRDWGEREKERVDRRSTMQVANTMQVVNTSNDVKDSAKEERDAERWERKDPTKDKERVKEREKDPVKRDLWAGVDKESTDKDVGDGGSNRLPEPDNLLSEKKHKESESWKTAEKESRDRKKERDGDGEGDRPERRNRGFEKESDDGCADAEGTVEREREVYNNYGVQQRKRMQRSRVSPQVTNREPRFRNRTQDHEGSQVTGKAEVSSVVYKVGECMQELIRLWKEYEASQTEKNGESSSSGPTLEIRIPAEHVTATNRQVRGGQLWGTDIYTDDSDLVAVLMHTGYCRPTASPPPSAIQELRATIRVLPPQDCYVSTLRNNVRSRAWGAAIGCSYRVERCCIVKKGGGTIDLEPCLTHTSTVEPTLAPVAVERTMTTRAAASNALRQQRFVREVTIQYNLCNEPWIKYSISIVADKGLKKPLYTSARLKKGEVLYLETHSCRYELCFTGEKMVRAMQSSQSHEPDSEKSQNHHSHSANGERSDSESIVIDAFRWSRCKKPLPQKVMRSVGIPLPLEYVEVLEENLDWEDVQWSQTGVWIAGKEYTLARVHFLSMNN